MPENHNKISKFIQAVTDHAAAYSRQVHEEVEAYKRERLAEVEKQALAESTALIKKEHAALQQEIRLELSRRELSAFRQLLDKRRQMAENIFSEATEKLIAFTEDSENYAAFLTASFRRISAVLPGEDTVYYASMRDKERQTLLQTLLPQGATLQFTEDIAIGGIRAHHVPSGRMLDDTLDTRLVQQREWFADASGLTIEQ